MLSRRSHLESGGCERLVRIARFEGSICSIGSIELLASFLAILPPSPHSVWASSTLPTVPAALLLLVLLSSNADLFCIWHNIYHIFAIIGIISRYSLHSANCLRHNGCWKSNTDIVERSRQTLFNLVWSELFFSSILAQLRPAALKHGAVIRG